MSFWLYESTVCKCVCTFSLNSGFVISFQHNICEHKSLSTLQVIANIKSSSTAGDDKVKSVKQEYERKITNMQQELKKLQTAQKEHTKLMRERSQIERQLRTLKGDLAEMKKTKVRVCEAEYLVYL